ncbi:MAG: hypothetical protein SRB2_02888 [Desulfobacteraceae bacterium Eth-SRB2]|nr:MAG: hypothetical protein SRB2_02888 [Desulfobacteraceae bacterium Eth-SRB2]
MIIWDNGIIERYLEKLDYAQFILYPFLSILAVEVAFGSVKDGLIERHANRRPKDDSPALVTYRERKRRLKDQSRALLVVRPREVTRKLGILKVEVETRQRPGRIGQLLCDLIG